MKKILIKLSLCLSLIAVSLAALSCSPKAYNKRYYILNAQRQTATGLKADSEIILDVRTFTIDLAFDSKGLVYRKDEFEYETDFYNEFLISPSAMITEKTRTWLSRSGLFKMVLDKAGLTEPTHRLEGNITALYADLTEQNAIMELRVFLIAKEPQADSVIMAEVYNVSRKLQSQTTESLIEAFDGCLTEILTKLENDLRKKL